MAVSMLEFKYSALLLLVILSIFFIIYFSKGIWILIVIILFLGQLFPYDYHYSKYMLFHRGGVYPGFVISPIHISLFISAVFLLLFYYKRLKYNFKIDRSIFIWIVFTIYAFLISFISVSNIEASFYEMIRMLLVGLLSIITYIIIYKEKQLYTLIRIIGIIIIAECVIVFLQQIGLLPHDLLFGDVAKTNIKSIIQLFIRPPGTLRHPNLLAIFLALYIPIYLTLSLVEIDIKKKLFFISVLSFSFLALLLTLGRSAIVGTIIGSLFSLFLISKYSSKYLPSKKIMISGLTIIITIIATIITIFFQLIYLRFFVLSNITAGGRFEQYQNALFIIKNNFFSGIGLNNYNLAMVINDISGIAAAEPQYPVHNLYLLYFAETGIIGIILLLLFIVSIYYKVFKVLKSTKLNIYHSAIIIGGIGGLTSIFLQSLLDWGVRSVSLFSVFFLWGLIIAAINTISQKSKKELTL
jgi:O-antigen ligase